MHKHAIIYQFFGICAHTALTKVHASVQDPTTTAARWIATDTAVITSRAGGNP